MKILERLHSFDTIDEMEAWLNQSDAEFLRAYLLKSFDAIKYYETADQWNDAVKICEALAIIGWGDRERVDATCSRRDQSHETSFKSETDDKCFRRANWLPRKAGRYLVNYNDYHGPSHSDRNSQTYDATREENIVCTPVDTMLSQRNYLVKQIFNFGGRLDTSNISWLISDYTNQLQDLLKNMINPVVYATCLESFRVRTSVGWAKQAYKFKPGRYYATRKAYDVSLHIDRDIENLSEPEQRLIIASGVRESVRAFIDRLKKRKLDFPSAQFEADVDLALDKFVAMKGLKPLSEAESDLRGFLTGFADAVKTHQKTDTETEPPLDQIQCPLYTARSRAGDLTTQTRDQIKG